MVSTLSSKHETFLHLFILWISFTVGIVLSISAEEEIKSEPYEFKLVPPVSEVVHFEGDSFIVSCQAYKSRLRWKNPQGNLTDALDRDRVHVEERGNGSALIFTAISQKENGTWTCQAEEGNREISFNMIVYKPITFLDTQVVQNVKENEDAVIKCMVTGDPEPSVSWYHNGQPLNLVDQEKYKKIEDGLLIRRVSKHDSGEYSCKAFQISSSLSNVKEQTIRLNIQHKPVAPIHRESADIQYGYIKGYVNVTCEAEAEPPATFRWYRNNKHLHSRHHQIITGEHISILQLFLNNSKQFGDYVCEANNSLGTLRRTITLINGTKPPPPPFIRLRGVNSNTFDLDVGAKKTHPSDPMDIIGYRFEILQKEENQSSASKWNDARVVLKDFTDGVTYLVNNLSPNTTYYVRAASRNPAGLSDWMGPEVLSTHAKAGFGIHSETTQSTSSKTIAMHSMELLVFFYSLYLFQSKQMELQFLD